MPQTLRGAASHMQACHVDAAWELVSAQADALLAARSTCQGTMAR